VGIRQSASGETKSESLEHLKKANSRIEVVANWTIVEVLTAIP
jgi:hypothetical protein